MYSKRLLTILSMLLVLSMILTACAAPAAPMTATEAPKPAGEATQAPAAAATATTAPAVAAATATKAPEAAAAPTATKAAAAAAGKKIKIGFLAGVQDPFYFTMQRGAEQAAADLGVELVTQIPEKWNTTVQTPMLDAMVARGDLDFLFLAPVDKEAMVAPLQKAVDAGLNYLTVDTYVGNGDYVKGPVTAPKALISSDNVAGGKIACNALAEAIGKKGKVYVQNTVRGASTTDQREEGCKEALKAYPDVTLVGVDYNDDDPTKAQAQVQAELQKDPDLGGIFGTNVFSAQGAGQVVANMGLSGKVKVVAFDATETAIEMLKAKTVDLVIAQKPADMGYMAVIMANAYLNGVTSIPAYIPTGYAIITRDNVDKPEIAKFIYSK